MFYSLVCTLYLRFVQGCKRETDELTVEGGVCIYVFIVREKCLRACLIISLLFPLKWCSSLLFLSSQIDFWLSQEPIFLLALGLDLELYLGLSPSVQRRCDFCPVVLVLMLPLSLRDEGNIICLLFTFGVFVHTRNTGANLAGHPGEIKTNGIHRDVNMMMSSRELTSDFSLPHERTSNYR